jgi:hypothetical protein
MITIYSRDLFLLEHFPYTLLEILSLHHLNIKTKYVTSLIPFTLEIIYNNILSNLFN